MQDLIEHDDHFILNLNNEISEESYPKIIDLTKTLIETKKHLIINFAFINNLDETFIHFLGTIKFLLSDLKKNVTLIYLPEAIEKLLQENWTDIFTLKTNLYESLHFIKENTVFPPISFLKNLVGQFMSSFLFTYQKPTSRGKVFIKENLEDKTLKENFSADKTTSTLLMNDEVFFHLAISFTDQALESFQKISSFDPLSFSKETISEILKRYPNLKLKIVEQVGTELMDKKIKKQPIFFNDESFKLFDKGITVVIPLSSFNGNIYFEFWVPDQFEKKVLSVINS